MIKWLRANRMAVAFLVVLLVLIANSVVMFRCIMQVSQAQAPLLDNMRLLLEFDRLRNSVIDAETGQRGYLLTGNPAYLQPYYSSVNLLQRELRQIRLLIGNQPEYAASVREVEALVDAKIQELNETIDLRKSRGLDAALRVVTTDQGKNTMDEIRALIG